MQNKVTFAGQTVNQLSLNPAHLILLETYNVYFWKEMASHDFCVKVIPPLITNHFCI